MLSEKRDVCIIFAKWPELGKVKTRLAAGSTPAFAVKFYRACCEHIVAAICSEKWEVVIAYSPSCISKDAFGDWLGKSSQMRFENQLDHPDLGARMHCAISGALEKGSAKAVLIGSDIPDLDASVIDAAFHALEHAQVVLGPALDGGFYLIGATALPVAVLQGIEWSTSTVLRETVANATASGLTVNSTALPVLQDIDTFHDLESWLVDADHRNGLARRIQRLMTQHLT